MERRSEGRLVVVDLKTSAHRYTDLQAEAALQLSVYSYRPVGSAETWRVGNGGAHGTLAHDLSTF